MGLQFRIAPHISVARRTHAVGASRRVSRLIPEHLRRATPGAVTGSVDTDHVRRRPDRDGASNACRWPGGGSWKDGELMMRLAEVAVRQDVRHSRLVATVERGRGREPMELLYEYSRDCAPLLRESADAFVPALLIPCMAHSDPLEIVPAISAKLHAALDIIQTILTQWWPELHRVPVNATARAADDSVTGAARASAAFFSGGVDSFYTCLKHARKAGSVQSPRLTHLVHMQGVEQPLERSVEVDVLRDDIRRAADHYGLDVVFGSTNIRSVCPLSWSMYYHGAGLASIGLSLAGGFGRVLIPSTHSFRHLLPWGSHPLLDPLWSTEDLAIVHDGCEMTRVEKTAAIADDLFPLQQLRVCLRNRAGPGNCGRCKKCIRTMVTLAALGVLSQGSTFPSSLPANFDGLLPVTADNDRAFVEEIVDFLEERKPGSTMARALSGRIRQSRRHAASRSYVENSPFSAALPAVRTLHGAAVRFASIVSHIG